MDLEELQFDTLACGDLSPLLPLWRLVSKAAPRPAARGKTDRPHLLDGDKSPAESADKSAHSKLRLSHSCLFVFIRGSLDFHRLMRTHHPARVAPCAFCIVNHVLRIRRHRDRVHLTMLRADRAAGAIRVDGILDKRRALLRQTPPREMCLVFVAEVTQRRQNGIWRRLAEPAQAALLMSSEYGVEPAQALSLVERMLRNAPLWSDGAFHEAGMQAMQKGLQRIGALPGAASDWRRAVRADYLG